MTTNTLRNLRLAAGAAWLVVGACGVRALMVNEGEDWELPYNVFALALLVGAVLTVVLLTAATGDAARPRLRVIGLAATVLGTAASFIAWALPVWMTVLGAGFALLAASSPLPLRRTVGLLAAGQLAGIATQFGCLAFGVSEDVASDLALVVTGAVMALALTSPLGQEIERPGVDGATTPRRAVPAES